MIKYRLKQKMDYLGMNWIYPQISFFFGLFWFYFVNGKPFPIIIAGINRFRGDIEEKEGEWDKARVFLQRVRYSLTVKSKYQKI